jgi:hypothetical protein
MPDRAAVTGGAGLAPGWGGQSLFATFSSALPAPFLHAFSMTVNYLSINDLSRVKRCVCF